MLASTFMKPFALVACAVALSGAALLGALRADAQSTTAPGAPQNDRDLAARLEAGKELAEVMSKDTFVPAVAQITSRAWPTVEQELRAKNPGIDAASIADLRKEFERIQIEFLLDLMKDAPAIYARHFTAQELRDLVAFYRTPLGTKTQQVMPYLSGEIMGLIIPRLQDVISRTNDAFTKILSQRGYKL
ncbi:MAG TPA: DUF2059 domain-containing protein [Xanthobacteraceae bacterium]|nr:DUF2059 domain-containing protein [Xanthobacteraceae bacterium]